MTKETKCTCIYFGDLFWTHNNKRKKYKIINIEKIENGRHILYFSLLL